MKSMTKTWSLGDITSLDRYHLCLRSCEIQKSKFWIFEDVFTWLSGLTKQPTFCHVTYGSSKKCLRNDCRNLILMMPHYTDLRSASDWLVEANFHPTIIRSTIQIWVVTCHQCGISVLLPQMSFSRETRGGITKCPLSAHRATCAAKSMHPINAVPNDKEAYHHKASLTIRSFLPLLQLAWCAHFDESYPFVCIWHVWRL